VLFLFFAAFFRLHQINAINQITETFKALEVHNTSPLQKISTEAVLG